MPLIKKPMQGIRFWENERNGFSVLEIHYSADPKKREPGAMETIKKAMSERRWRQEYEIEWDSFEGKPVYPDFDVKRHVVDEVLWPHVGLPLLVGIDFGLTPAAIFCQLQEDQFVVMEEMIGMNIGIERFSDRIIQKIRTEYPAFSDLKKSVRLCIDPSGNFRKDTDENTCARILAKKGFKTYPGPIPFEERRSSVEYYLLKRTRAGECFKISSVKCPLTIRGFTGGYRYDDKEFDKDIGKVRPVKDEHSHPHDALQYATSHSIAVNKRMVASIPRPEYIWTQGSMNGR